MTTAPSAPPRTHSNLARFLIVVLLLFIATTALLWYTGALKPRPKIAIVTAQDTGVYWEMIVRGAEDAAERYKVNLAVIRPKPDEASQTAAIQSLLESQFDGIGISPNDPQRQAALLADVGAHTNLVMYDSDTPVSTRLCFLGTDNYDAGRTCGQQIRQAIPEGGEVILAIGSLDKENGQRRRQGVIDRTARARLPADAADGSGGWRAAG
jgi:ribose transport system substrate-binding protein